MGAGRDGRRAGYGEDEGSSEKLGLMQEEAAHRAGLPGRARWNDIESDRKANVTVQTLDAIAQALGVHSAELLTKG